MEKKPYLIDELSKGDTFRSKWFKGLVMIIGKDIEKNILYVEIDPEEDWRNKWQEEWDLRVTCHALERREYYQYTPVKFGDIDESIIPLGS
jgi:hypothetical protein